MAATQGWSRRSCPPRRKAPRRPLWVKLSPNVTDIGVIAKAAESAGADALTVANTYQAMSIDIHTRKSRLGRPTGGLSGPAIKPITLRLVYEARRAVKIPVIGLGGIEKAEDVHGIYDSRSVSSANRNGKFFPAGSVFADPGAAGNDVQNNNINAINSFNWIVSGRFSLESAGPAC